MKGIDFDKNTNLDFMKSNIFWLLYVFVVEEND